MLRPHSFSQATVVHHRYLPILKFPITSSRQHSRTIFPELQNVVCQRLRHISAQTDFIGLGIGPLVELMELSWKNLIANVLAGTYTNLNIAPRAWRAHTQFISSYCWAKTNIVAKMVWYTYQATVFKYAHLISSFRNFRHHISLNWWNFPVESTLFWLI